MTISGRIWAFAAALASLAAPAGLLSACEASTFPDGNKTLYGVCRPVDVHKSPGGKKLDTVEPHTVDEVARRGGWVQLSTSWLDSQGGRTTRTGWTEERELSSDKFDRVDADTYRVCRPDVSIRVDKNDHGYRIALPVTYLELLPPIKPKKLDSDRLWHVRAYSFDKPTITGWVNEKVFR